MKNRRDASSVIWRTVVVAGAMAGAQTKALAYEPIYEWINGMGVILHSPS